MLFPAGNYNGSFNNVGSNSNFWTATENDSSNAYNRNLDTGASMSSNNNNKNNGYSVRLVEDSNEKHRKLSLSELFLLLKECYYEARKHKRNTKSQLQFELNLESNLLELANQLYYRTYNMKPSVCFINEKPVKREVIAADFRDRIVHHLLCRWLFPIFERLFIYDSYSCRKNKGTLFGVNRIRKFIKSASNNFTKECWSLRLDIKGFFMSINKQKLYNLIIEGLQKQNYAKVEDIDLCNFLIRKIVFANPIKNCVFNSPFYKWNDLPKDKSLKYNSDNKGLPIGNLTSQLFANIYLNPLDHFVKRILKIKYYGRYVDDMILISTIKQQLLETINKIRIFLKERLLLELHPKKVKLQDIKKGFSFLGVFILPCRVFPSFRIRNNFNNTLYNNPNESDNYFGLFSYLNGCY